MPPDPPTVLAYGRCAVPSGSVVVVIVNAPGRGAGAGGVEGAGAVETSPQPGNQEISEKRITNRKLMISPRRVVGGLLSEKSRDIVMQCY